MWNSLHSFYCSKEWVALKDRLLSEREDSNGDIVCAHCHKPITKDVLRWHHTEYLTLENVNDYNVSLNPDKIVAVHHNCHNEIHERWGKFNQHIYLVYGAPLSGKTTYVKNVATKNDLVIDMDIIRSAITGAKLYDRSGYTDADVFAVRDILLDRVKHKLTKARNIYIIGGYPHRRDREEMVKTIKCEPIFLDITKEECLARLDMQTDKDKTNWTKYIEDWFFKASF